MDRQPRNPNPEWPYTLAARAWIVGVIAIALWPLIALAQESPTIESQLEQLALLMIPVVSGVVVSLFGRLWSWLSNEGSVPDWILPVIATACGIFLQWLGTTAEVISLTNPFLGAALGGFATTAHQSWKKGSAAANKWADTPRKEYGKKQPAP